MNQEHYNEIKKGPKSWNAYVKAERAENPAWFANLRFANLQSADLQDANLQSADLRFADLQGANLQSAEFSDLPERPKDLLQQIAVAAHKTDGLEMGSWHTCDTRHCVAGWVITLTPGGKELEERTSPDTAGRLLAPELAHLFYEDNDTALEELKKYLPEGKK